jgi:hypothetical protein
MPTALKLHITPSCADELRSLAAGARKCAEHYREHPEEITRSLVVELYIMIARLCEQLTRPSP